jgi:hypothetical protein
MQLDIAKGTVVIRRRSPVIRRITKLCCGRYITEAQVRHLFKPKDDERIKQQFDYESARKILEPLLLNEERHDHTYTHMYIPLLTAGGKSGDFYQKIKTDFKMIHSPPDPATETLLISVHGMAEKWLLHYAQKNVLMIPGNLRAGLQMFEGHEDVNGISQHSTYTLQHNPKATTVFKYKIT